MATPEDMGLQHPSHYVQALRSWAKVTDNVKAADAMREAAAALEIVSDELDRLHSGLSVVLPSTREHAEAMCAVATAVLDRPVK